MKRPPPSSFPPLPACDDAEYHFNLAADDYSDGRYIGGWISEGAAEIIHDLADEAMRSCTGSHDDDDQQADGSTQAPAAAAETYAENLRRRVLRGEVDG